MSPNKKYTKEAFKRICVDHCITEAEAKEMIAENICTELDFIKHYYRFTNRIIKKKLSFSYMMALHNVSIFKNKSAIKKLLVRFQTDMKSTMQHNTRKIEAWNKIVTCIQGGYFG